MKTFCQVKEIVFSSYDNTDDLRYLYESEYHIAHDQNLHKYTQIFWINASFIDSTNAYWIYSEWQILLYKIKYNPYLPSGVKFVKDAKW